MSKLLYGRERIVIVSCLLYKLFSNDQKKRCMRLFYVLAGLLLFQTGLFGQISLVKDIAEGTSNSSIRNVFAAQGLLFFEADDGTNGDQLWISDGTDEGTFMVIINQDPEDSSPNADPQNFILYNDLIYFNADNGDASLNDKELWVTDGTAENTMLAANLEADTLGPEGSNPQDFFVFDGNLYFQARVNNSNELWRFDGTDVEQATNIGGPGVFATVRAPYVDEANNRVWLTAQNTTANFEPYLFNGDTAVLVKDINPDGNGYSGNAILYNGNLVFEGDDDVNGDELWISDGTEEGTVMVLDINPGGENSDPDDFAIYNGEVYFKAEVDADANEELWKTDGTAAGTVMVAAPNPGGDGEVAELFVANGLLMFAANDGTNGIELWAYDGTTAAMVKDINPVGDSDPESFVALDGKVYFAADGDDDGDAELWVTDGTAEGTQLVSSTFDMSDNPIDIDNLTVNDGKLYFTGEVADPDLGDELYVLMPMTTSTTTPIAAAPFEVFPNPSANGTFFFKGENMDQARYNVVDAQGRIVANGMITSNRIQLDQPTGNYYLWITHGEQSYIKKVMIAR
jgi:ELWxxDGT repeat protein